MAWPRFLDRILGTRADPKEPASAPSTSAPYGGEGAAHAWMLGDPMPPGSPLEHLEPSRSSETSSISRLGDDELEDSGAGEALLEGDAALAQLGGQRNRQAAR